MLNGKPITAMSEYKDVKGFAEEKNGPFREVWWAAQSNVEQTQFTCFSPYFVDILLKRKTSRSGF
jgi:hypothetical protein